MAKSLITSSYLERHFDEKLLDNVDKKFKIAKTAVEMIPDKGVVILDSGTTVLQITKLLNSRSNLVIITSSLIVAQVLQNTKNKLIVTGGELREKSKSFVGYLAASALESVHDDIAFIGCDGFHKNGPSSRSYRELEVKQRIFRNSKEVVLVTDSSKFNVYGLYRFATFNQINHLITDTGINEKQLKLLTKNIKVSIV